MKVHQVTSLHDPLAAVYRNLPALRSLRESGRFIVEGRFLVERAYASGLAIESILTDESHLELARANSLAGTAILLAPRTLLEEIVGFSFHRGLLACGVRPLERSLQAVLDQVPPQCTLVICDDIVDPQNVGGVVRNAAAFGAHAVVLGDTCADPFGRRVLRVSMGAAFTIAALRSRDLSADMELLNRHGFEVAATVLDDAATPLGDYLPAPRVAVVLGNEGRGLDPSWRQRSDVLVTIPIQSQVDSLNVAAASAVFLHHVATRHNVG